MQVLYVDTKTTLITTTVPADFDTRVQQEITVGANSTMPQLLAALGAYISVGQSLTAEIPRPILKIMFI